MKKYYQSDWHGILFKDFIEPSSTKIAGLEFYTKFYREFFNRYSAFDDLPLFYTQDKKNVADWIITECEGKNNILSIGCGIGLIENLILGNPQFSAKLVVVEPSGVSLKWLKLRNDIDVHEGFFPEALNNSQTFDFGYARAIDYIYDEQEYHNLLMSVKDYGIKEFSIISVSVHKPSLLDSTKDLVKNILGTFRLRDRGQFWGYMRTENEQIAAFKKAGFSKVKCTRISHYTLCIQGIAE